MTSLAFSLVSHTNVGKTTLARTLLGRDIGTVADAAHVTAEASRHELLRSPEGDQLELWDTPGLGDSVRLVRRLQQRANPLGWLVGEVWDRWREPSLWASQQLLLHLRAEGDLVLYLVNSAEPPAASAHVQAEMALLQWLGRPVIVLLNQTGPPRAAAQEGAEAEAWRQALAPWPLVRAVLPLDAFARCWVQEDALWRAAEHALAGESQAAMQRLHSAWAQAQGARFDRAVAALAASAVRLAAQQHALPAANWGDSVRGALRGLGQAAGRAVGRAAGREGPTALPPPLAQAASRLEAEAAAELKDLTDALVALHGLDGQAALQLHERVAGRYQWQRPLVEGHAAAIGGVVSGALGGLVADLASGGLSLGAGMVAGGALGALGSAAAARGLNLRRGGPGAPSRLRWTREAWQAQLEALLLRYLSVAHYGRGRGGWVEGEAPGHWAPEVAQALAAQAAQLDAAWSRRESRPAPEAAQPLAQALGAALRSVLTRLYPDAAPWPDPAPASASGAHNEQP